MRSPPGAVQRALAVRFASALLRGDGPRARNLLARDDDGSRVFLVEQAVTPWRSTQYVRIEPPSRAGDAWTFGFVRRRTEPDGRFQTQEGDIVVIVGPSAAAAGIEFFAFKYVRTRFSTHHDAQLLPSKR